VAAELAPTFFMLLAWTTLGLALLSLSEEHSAYEGDWFMFTYAMFLAAHVGGLGWFLSRNYAVGCMMLVFRVALLVATFFAFVYAIVPYFDDAEGPLGTERGAEPGAERWILYWSVIAVSALSPIISAYSLAKWRGSLSEGAVS
jgi:hypothetical protein